MDSKDQIDSTGNQHFPDKSAKNEIPLWLQGLEEPSPDSSVSEPESDWVKEEIAGEIPPSEEKDEQGQPETHQPEAMDSANPEDETKIPVNEQESAPPPQDERGLSHEAMAAEEGFIEISEYDFGLDQNGQPGDAMLSDDEELPDWLHEMIVETPEIVPEEIKTPVIEEVEETIDEPTEPMKIPQEMIQEVEEEDVELLEVAPEPLEEIPVIEPDLPYVAEEPGPEPSLAIEPEPEEEEQPEEQEVPRMLKFAKYLLDEGDARRAVEIFTSFMGQSLYREQIKDWLTAYTQQDKEVEDSAIWESLGDIAMQDGDSGQAFIAYTKAIQILVTSSRDTDEMD